MIKNKITFEPKREPSYLTRGYSNTNETLTLTVPIPVHSHSEPTNALSDFHNDRIDECICNS